MADLFASVYNPDVLSCLANLSNDEVFTPPELANQVLDMLPESIWLSTTAKFLDPCSKSGVFLREIAKRLIRGQLPDFEYRTAQIDAKRIAGEDLDGSDEAYLYRLQKVLDHIFHEQIYGIAITELTSLLTRRSLYCSKWANSPYSVSAFDNVAGNIRYRAMQHTWEGPKGKEKCKWCGASKKELVDARSSDETHAYELIHIRQVERIWNMQFDVIVGNPPYQLKVGVENENYAVPIYDKFVEQAKKLNPRYLAFIIPARWYAGGRGLKDFRDTMLSDDRLRVIHDYPDATDVFPGVQIKAGVCYFLWNRDNRGECAVTTHLNGEADGPVERPLLEPGNDTFIRYNKSISILRKVSKAQGPNPKSFSELVSPQTPFGIVTSYKGFEKRQNATDYPMYISGNDRRFKGKMWFAPAEKVTKGHEMIPWHKLYINMAGSGSDTFPHQILSKPFYGEPGTICNQSYLVIGPFDSAEQAKNAMSYIATKFFRFLVLQKKNAQHAMRGVYQFVPMQDFSKAWTDAELYEMYHLSADEIAFIESMIKPMTLGGQNA